MGRRGSGAAFEPSSSCPLGCRQRSAGLIVPPCLVGTYVKAHCQDIVLHTDAFSIQFGHRRRRIPARCGGHSDPRPHHHHHLVRSEWGRREDQRHCDQGIGEAVDRSSTRACSRAAPPGGACGNDTAAALQAATAHGHDGASCVRALHSCLPRSGGSSSTPPRRKPISSSPSGSGSPARSSSSTTSVSCSKTLMARDLHSVARQHGVLCRRRRRRGYVVLGIRRIWVGALSVPLVPGNLLPIVASLLVPLAATPLPL